MESEGSTPCHVNGRGARERLQEIDDAAAILDMKRLEGEAHGLKIRVSVVQIRPRAPLFFNDLTGNC